ncbi:unnamed protein product, partial [marine sediment metagenome]
GLEKARGLGVPRTAEERVAAHYGIDVNEARRWLAIHPESELLPERGAGFARGTAAGAYIGQLAEMAVGASVPIATRGLVHVTGRNDMTTPQEMGISWVVKDPDGLIVEEHTDDWAGWPYPTDVDPGDTHEFIGGRFDINKPGDWTISIGLFMNSDSPVMVDSYDGVLCRVTEEYAGTIIKKELEYDSVRGDIPVL